MDEITVRLPLNIKAKVTEGLKEKIIRDLKERLELVDHDLESIEFQAKRLMSEQVKIDAQGLISLRAQVEEEKQKRIDYKAEINTNLKEAEALEIGSEISQGSLEQTVVIKVGDDLNKLMATEILLEDGKIIAFRQ